MPLSHLDAVAGNNPLDLIEEVMQSNEWSFERIGRDELAFEATGQWRKYTVTLYWHNDSAALLLTTELDLFLQSNRHRAMVWETLSLVNESMGFGCFFLHPERGGLSYRQSSLWRGVSEVSFERIEDMIEIALAECERFFPVFHTVIHHRRKPLEALEMGMMLPIGEA